MLRLAATLGSLDVVARVLLAAALGALAAVAHELSELRSVAVEPHVAEPATGRRAGLTLVG